MSHTPIRLDRAGARARLVLDRPDKRNALTGAMWRAIPGLAAEAADDPGVKALVVTGAGAAFAAGADIAEFEKVTAAPEAALAFSQAIEAAMNAIADFPKPTLAAIAGPCMGAGCAIALACDVRFADAEARFGVTPAKLGLAYPLSDIKRLVDAVGLSTAKDLLFTGRVIDAATARDIGLIDRAAPPGGLDAMVETWLGEIEAGSGFTARQTKKMLALIEADGARETDRSRALFLEAFENPDFAEGYRAFLEKRAPKFP